MLLFLELTSANGNPILIFLDKIVAVQPPGEASNTYQVSLDKGVVFLPEAEGLRLMEALSHLDALTNHLAAMHEEESIPSLGMGHKPDHI